MSNIDQFESLFRSAIHDVYDYQKLSFRNLLVVTDLEASAGEEFVNQLKQFSMLTGLADDAHWHSLNKGDFLSTSELLDAVNKLQPELIFTYRNMHSKAWQHPHSLGEHLDVLIQKTDAPVFILPHPEADYAMEHTMKNCDVVMALTDHLSNDHDLVNHAVHFTQSDGALYLVHVEDADIFDRYINAISKIQSINTEDAKEKLAIDVRAEVSFGHHLTEFRKCIDDYKVDLLVMNAKDHQQMVMPGLSTGG